jgi:membrane protease YdiL (CAAX protease family)
MVNFGPHELLLGLLSVVVLTVFAGMFASWGWLLTRLARGEPVFPADWLAGKSERPAAGDWDDPGDLVAGDQGPNAVESRPPWGGWSILTVIVVYVGINMVVARSYAIASGRMARARQATPAAAKGNPPKAASAIEVEAPDFAMTEVMFVNSVGNVIVLIVLPCLLYLTSGARPADLGVSGRRWWRHAAVGVVGMLITTPAVWLVQFAAIKIWKPHGHPLEKMLREQFSFGVGYLAVVSAVVLAPIAEELLFRAIIQQWLIKVLKRRAVRQQTIEPYVELSGVTRSDSSTGIEFWEEDQPFAPPRGASRPVDASADNWATSRAIILTSLFFALLHAPQWPAPIPIFVLSLVLGTVYVRTGSLIAPVIMHASFNGLSTIAMFVALLSQGLIDEKKVPAPEAACACINAIGKEAVAEGELGERGLIKREIRPFFCRRN